MSPAYGMHIHGTLFKAYPSGIWSNPPVDVQSWELASGNTAILEAKWPWPGKFTFHFHGIPEERGAMGYFNVTNATAADIDGKDIAINKSISMDAWQMNLTKSLQKQDPYGNVTTIDSESSGPNMDHNDMSGDRHHGLMMDSGNGSLGLENGMLSTDDDDDDDDMSNNSTKVSIVQGATTLGDKAYSPNHLKIKVGSTVLWTNNDINMHTVRNAQFTRCRRIV